MNEVKRLLKDEAVSAQIRGAKSASEAAKVIVKAAKDKGITLKVSEVTAWLKDAPRKDVSKVTHPELVSMAAIKTTWETKLSACSKVCCNTCRTSAIIW